jgi:hypothetical protein
MYLIGGKTIKQISEETGVTRHALRQRLRDHYDMRIITRPLKKQAKRGSLKAFIDQQSALQGVTRKAIQMRILRGWSQDEIIQGHRNVVDSETV